MTKTKLRNNYLIYEPQSAKQTAVGGRKLMRSSKNC